MVGEVVGTNTWWARVAAEDSNYREGWAWRWAKGAFFISCNTDKGQARDPKSVSTVCSRLTVDAMLS